METLFTRGLRKQKQKRTREGNLSQKDDYKRVRLGL